MNNENKVIEFSCNKCGNNLGMEHDPTPYGLVEQKVRGHYYSEHLTDCTEYTFSLCEKCLRELFNSFKIPPKLYDYMCGDERTYEQDLDWFNYTVWRDSGGQKAKCGTGICNCREWCKNKAEWRRFISDEATIEEFCTEHKEKYTFSNSNWEFILLPKTSHTCILTATTIGGLQSSCKACEEEFQKDPDTYVRSRK